MVNEGGLRKFLVLFIYFFYSLIDSDGVKNDVDAINLFPCSILCFVFAVDSLPDSDGEESIQGSGAQEEV